MFVSNTFTVDTVNSYEMIIKQIKTGEVYLKKTEFGENILRQLNHLK